MYYRVSPLNLFSLFEWHCPYTRLGNDEKEGMSAFLAAKNELHSAPARVG